MVVSNTLDSGPGSLRQTIETANAIAREDTIIFNIPDTDANFVDVDSSMPGGDADPDVYLIRPLTPLPALIGSTILDGRTQNIFGDDSNPFGPDIVLDGQGMNEDGLVVQGSQSAVYGLNIQRFRSGIQALAAQEVVIAGNYIGTDPTGSSASSNAASGLHISSSSNVTVGGLAEADRNLISGNTTGISIIGASSINNRILGNYIGTDRTGEIDLGNRFNGIRIETTATVSATSQTLIRGNLISGNGLNGVELSGSNGNVVIGNTIGTNVIGSVRMGNAGSGIRIFNASDNRVGTDGDGLDDAVEGNLISGNREGIVIVAFPDRQASGNVVAGNRIGVNADGTAVFEQQVGVSISTAADNYIGTNGDGLNDAAEGNLISGNNLGVRISGAATGNVVAGNLIGTNAEGAAAIANTSGVLIAGGAARNLIGTNSDGVSDVAERNVISGVRYGVSIESGATQNVVAGNLIGTNAAGDAAISSQVAGVQIDAAANNLIGTNADGVRDAVERNLISGNFSDGVLITRGSSGNVVAGNLIGTNAAASAAIQNARGVLISEGAFGNRIGANGDSLNDAAEANVISGNRIGVVIWQTGSDNNLVAGNYIGTNKLGADLGNVGAGVLVRSGARSNLIGGDEPTIRNVIAFNGGPGVSIQDSLTTGNFIQLNSIHDNDGLGIDLGDDGVTVNDLGDADDGANHLQNFPLLSTAWATASSLRVRGTLNSAPNSEFRIEFFANTNPHDSGFGEGEQLLGLTFVRTDVNGNASFVETFAGNFTNHFITATAIDLSGNSSEFSAAIEPLVKQDTVGLFAPDFSGFFLRNEHSGGAADVTFTYGPDQSGWMPLAGDWDFDGIDTPALYDKATGVFYLRNSNSPGPADLVFQYGPGGEGLTPIIGDWDGDGADSVGLYQAETAVFYLRNSNLPGFADFTFDYGPLQSGWLPLSGDWDGDRVATVGLYNPVSGVFFLRNEHAAGAADLTYQFGPGNAGWLPLVGDWDADGQDTVGVFAPADSRFYLVNSHRPGVADIVFPYGPANQGWLPFAGHWGMPPGGALRVGGPTIPPERSDRQENHLHHDAIDQSMATLYWDDEQDDVSRDLAIDVLDQRLDDALDLALAEIGGD